jgi:hypothetical protein
MCPQLRMIFSLGMFPTVRAEILDERIYAKRRTRGVQRLNNHPTCDFDQLWVLTENCF